MGARDRRNRAIDALRSASRPAPKLDRDDESVLESQPAGERTEAEAIRRETAGRLRRALGLLPREQSQVIELAYFGGFSHSEIADILGAPIGTIKGRMRLGLEKIRATLAEGIPEEDVPGAYCERRARARGSRALPRRPRGLRAGCSRGASRRSSCRVTSATASPAGAAAVAADGRRPAAALGRAARAAGAASEAIGGDRAAEARTGGRAGIDGAEQRRLRELGGHAVAAGDSGRCRGADRRRGRRRLPAPRAGPVELGGHGSTVAGRAGEARRDAGTPGRVGDPDHVAPACPAPPRRLRGVGAARRHARSPRACSCPGATGPPMPPFRGRSTTPTPCW